MVMLDRSRTTQRCPECSTRLPWDATVCPNCGQELSPGRLSEHCPECGARMAPGAAECPICGAQRTQAGSQRVLGRWGRPAGVVALAAFVMAVLLIRPWHRFAPSDIQVPNVALLPTATFTPTRRPTLERPAAVAARMTPTEVPVLEITIPPTRTPTPTPITPTPTRPATHTVVAGDTPSGIAARYGVTTADLLAANGLTLRAVLRIGQELIIPGSASADPARATPEGDGAPRPTDTPAPTETPAPTATATATPSPTATASPTHTLAPTHTPAPTATRRTQALTYLVQAGDTLSEIANAYGLTAAALAEANGIDTGATLSIGQELLVPALPESAAGTGGATPTSPATPLVHVVRSGDTLGRIALLYDVSADAIAAANGIGISSMLSIGQELIVPGRYSDAPPATATPTATGTPEPTATMASGAASPTGAPAATPEAPGTPAPARVVHVVGQGDTLGSIAVKYGVSSERIASANGIRVTSLLRIGQELIIPDTSLSPTPEPTPTATMTPTPTPTVSPTPTATRVPGFIYAGPRLLAPVCGTSFQGKDANILVNWTSVGILAGDEWYVVKVWRAEDEDEPTMNWTKATSWRVPRGMSPGDGNLHHFEWQVNVMRRPLGAQTGVAISPSSAVYQFSWQ